MEIVIDVHQNGDHANVGRAERKIISRSIISVNSEKKDGQSRNKRRLTRWDEDRPGARKSQEEKRKYWSA